jgi:hypothetical protein
MAADTDTLAIVLIEMLEPYAGRVRDPADWAEVVNEAMDPLVLERVQLSLQRGRPYGTEPWTIKTVKRLGLESTLRDPWRPKKEKKKARTTKRRVRRK